MNAAAANVNNSRALRQFGPQQNLSFGEQPFRNAIFDAATTKGATVQMLGDALAAVSLCTKKQPDAGKAVQNASLNLIRDGDESRIPEMADLLESYGDKTLAEDYLNCGQPDLDEAATKWAHEQGYSISVGGGSNRAMWGSRR